MMDNIPVVQSLDELIQELRSVFESDQVNIDYVKTLMTNYKSNREDWKKYAVFDRFRYTRNLVDSGNGKYNLMLLCWGDGHASPIHDHADAHCFMKMLQGQLTEIRYDWPQDKFDTEMTEIGNKVLDLNDVCYINDSLGLHRVLNASDEGEGAVSLHLYCPPYDKCSIFDKKTGQKSVAQVTFWSMYGEKRERKSINM